MKVSTTIVWGALLFGLSFGAHSGEGHEKHSSVHDESAVNQESVDHDHSGQRVVDKQGGRHEKNHDLHEYGEHTPHGDHGEEARVAQLSDVQQKLAGIETFVAQEGEIKQLIRAPGEVVLNAYRTTQITPRTAAQVIQRHVRLGDFVKKGQPLVTLSSMEMAQAQGELIQASEELRRVKKLGQKVVSGKRFVTAQIAYQLAYAKVSAYGMTPEQIKVFLRKGEATRATGQFSLLSLQDGTVMSDDFIVGELINPGQVLMKISDESVLWVEARLTPDDAAHIQVGDLARIQVGERWISGKVVQARHALDEVTRTLSVNIEVANEQDSIHPGQFVRVIIEGGENSKTSQGVIVPVVAVLRSPDGHWQVFEEIANGVFEPREVRVVQTVGDQMLIEGVEAGRTLVGQGAFFVQSEMAKGGFDPHNH